jgi:hypothetical protein
MDKENLPLDDELYRRVKIYCAEHDLRMVELIRKQVAELLEKADKKKTKS